MGAFHFTAKILKRSAGQSAVRSAAYRSGSKLFDERAGKTENYTRKNDVVRADILAPEGSPLWLFDRERLWNAVEARENRRDAQLAQEFEINLPREFSDEENWRLVTDFAKSRLVSDGRICDIAFHKGRATDGGDHPHAHIMMPLRVFRDGTFAEKHSAVDWRNFFGRTDTVSALRVDWCEFSRARAAELGIDLGPDWDHRSYIDRGVDIEGQPKIGGAAARMKREYGTSERTEEVLATMRRNGERLLADPSIALLALTNRQSTFTEQDLARWVHKHCVDEQYAEIVAGARAQAIALGKDDRGQLHFSTQDMIVLEGQMMETASVMEKRLNHYIDPRLADRAFTKSDLSEEQRLAAVQIVSDGDLSCLVGYAGAGKSTMLGEVRQLYEKDGYRVHGAALSGIAAENLEQGSGIAARTLASWSYAWSDGRDLLGKKDILIIDEAGMIGSRQMAEVLDRAQRASAKVILVGDPEQLQAIEAGASFRAIQERTGAAELTQIRRQETGWQREATRELATGETKKALGRYRSEGHIESAIDQNAAHQLLIEKWRTEEKADLIGSRIMLAHTRADVEALNLLAREDERERGKLGRDFQIQTGRGERSFAEGDRLVFLRNDREMNVRNGTLGTLSKVKGGVLTVETDDGRAVSIDTGRYRDIDHGYAVTIHKAQGITVDRSFVLVTDAFDRHLTYVALSRHRKSVDVVYAGDSFKSDAHMDRMLSRERSKDVTSDYSSDAAEIRYLSPEDVTPAGIFKRRERDGGRSTGFER
ncbi:MAG: Ti-type conjugative transfer relaxase TraA [Alphaproteobacteria bacterium]|nr:Ti-type conjugative transfer relaxase TraA [Reyranella sp.]MBL6940093.1 Ti-type conjugative transfer relaxase TraA [Alphaproteobacteria bacterium]MBL7100180.1 Ti-type conjugative transfer relaxase TraA [Alphaproteobacteria bacterium]